MANSSLFGKNQPHRLRRKEQSKVKKSSNMSAKIKKKQEKNQIGLIDFVDQYRPKCLELIAPLLEKNTNGEMTSSDCIRALAIDKWYSNKLERFLKKTVKIQSHLLFILNDITKNKLNKFLLNSSKKLKDKTIIENQITIEIANIEQEIN